jgi:hypothetical protein
MPPSTYILAASISSRNDREIAFMGWSRGVLGVCTTGCGGLFVAISLTRRLITAKGTPWSQMRCTRPFPSWLLRIFLTSSFTSTLFLKWFSSSEKSLLTANAQRLIVKAGFPRISACVNSYRSAAQVVSSYLELSVKMRDIILFRQSRKPEHIFVCDCEPLQKVSR